ARDILLTKDIGKVDVHSLNARMMQLFANADRGAKIQDRTGMYVIPSGIVPLSDQAGGQKQGGPVRLQVRQPNEYRAVSAQRSAYQPGIVFINRIRDVRVSIESESLFAPQFLEEWIGGARKRSKGLFNPLPVHCGG